MNIMNQTGNADQRKAKEINLKELYLVIKRQILAVLVVTILAATVGYIQSTASVTPLYQSSSRIIIGADEESRKTLQVIVKDSTILDKVIQNLNLKTSSESLASQITVSSIDQSQVVSITVVDPNPKLAADIANTTARVFKDEVPLIVGKDYVRLLSDAKVNPIPVNKANKNKLLISIIIGLVLGIGLAFLLDSFDDRIRSEEELEKLLGFPVLGKVSKMNKKNVTKKHKKRLELRGETIGFK